MPGPELVGRGLAAVGRHGRAGEPDKDAGIDLLGFLAALEAADGQVGGPDAPLLVVLQGQGRRAVAGPLRPVAGGALQALVDLRAKGEIGGLGPGRHLDGLSRRVDQGEVLDHRDQRPAVRLGQGGEARHHGAVRPVNAAGDGLEEVCVGGVLVAGGRAQFEDAELQVPRALAQDVGAGPFAVAFRAMTGGAFPLVELLAALQLCRVSLRGADSEQEGQGEGEVILASGHSVLLQPMLRGTKDMAPVTCFSGVSPTRVTRPLPIL